MSKIRVVVATHQGKLYDETCEHVTVKAHSGEFAIYENHVPICTTIVEGYVKLVTNEVYYIGVVNALVEFSSGVCNIAAQEAHVGKSYEDAKKFLESINNERLDENKKIAADYTQSEKEIRENLKKSKAGSL